MAGLLFPGVIGGLALVSYYFAESVRSALGVLLVAGIVAAGYPRALSWLVTTFLRRLPLPWYISSKVSRQRPAQRTPVTPHSNLARFLHLSPLLLPHR